MPASSRSRTLRGAASAAILLLGGVASAQPDEAAGAAARRDPAALAAVERMAKTLAGTQAFGVGGEIAWDVVQADGQTLEFGATRKLVLRRPDRLHVSMQLREGGERELLYDGKQVVLHDPGHGVYAVAPRSGSVVDVAEFLGRRLGIPVALAEFLSPDLGAKLSDNIVSAHLVGTSTIDGVACDHVALRNDTAGMQLWIGQEDALPRRVSITYEAEEGRPQFRARFEDWDLSPRVSDDTFTFEPPKGVERIEFAVQGPAPQGASR